MNRQKPASKNQDNNEDVKNQVFNTSQTPSNTPFDKAQGKPFDSAQGKKLLAGIVVVLGVLIAVGAGVYFYAYQTTQDKTACTAEAKICPDGSSVGRTGPNCEFSQCPGEEGAGIDTSDWKTYRNEEYWFEVKYPQDWIVTPESRIGGPVLLSNFSRPKAFSESNNLPDGRIWVQIYLRENSCTNRTIEFRPLFKDSPDYTAVGKDACMGGFRTFLAYVDDNRNPLSQNMVKNNQDILNTILSTFKFIE